MTNNFNSRKNKILKLIGSIKSEQDLEAIEKYVQTIKSDINFKEILKPPRKSISIEQLKKEQNYNGIDKEEFDRLINELDIEEPLEELLSMLD